MQKILNIDLTIIPWFIKAFVKNIPTIKESFLRQLKNKINLNRQKRQDFQLLKQEYLQNHKFYITIDKEQQEIISRKELTYSKIDKTWLKTTSLKLIEKEGII